MEYSSVELSRSAGHYVQSLLILRNACPANYQQEAVSIAGPGGGGGYAPANPYNDRSNANIINRGGYSTQPYG